MYCKNCGNQVGDEARFCGSCGGEVTKSQDKAANSAASAPRSAGAPAASAGKRGGRIGKILVPTIAALLLLAVGIGLLPRLFGGGKYPFEKGASVEQNIRADKSATVGSLGKTGWRLEIPADTLEEDGKLTMKVLSEAEAQSYQSDDFEFYGTPVEIRLDDKEHTLLGAPVSVTLQIPKDQREGLAAEELFFATYDNGAWEYVMPDSVDLAKGTATVEIYHFSFWGFGKPSEAKQIETYAKNLAALEWTTQNRAQKLKDALGRRYDDLFKSMGVDSESVCGQFTADVLSALEDAHLDTSGVAPIDALAQMANAASKGQEGMQEFQNKLLEFTGKAICRVMEKDPEKFASYVNVIGGLGTAAGAMSEGDTEGALRGVADILRGSHPMVAVADSALTFIKDSMENAVDIWSRGELEKGYQVYIGNAAGRWGADSGLEGDIDGIFVTMGGGERAFNMKIVGRYCEKYGIKESGLSPEDRDKIIEDAKSARQRTFDERRASEAGIAKIQKKEESFIAELKAQDLLKPYAYEKFFGQKNGGTFDVGDRLEKLYQIRSLVFAYVDKDKREGLTDKQLAIIIRQWVSFSEKKDRAGFFKYLRDSGYVVEPLKVDPSFAWVLADTVTYDRQKEIEAANKSYEGTYSFSANAAPGSYDFTRTYVGASDTWYDPDMLHGETYTAKCTWTVPPSVIKGGETVKLELNLSFTALNLSFFGASASAGADFDKWDVEPGYVTGGSVRFKNKDGKDHFAIDYGKKVLSVSDTLTAVAPAGREEGDKIALRTTFYSGQSLGACYIYVWTRVG